MAPHASTPDTLLLSALVTLSGLCTASSSSRPHCQALQSPQTPSPGKPQPSYHPLFNSLSLHLLLIAYVTSTEFLILFIFHF